MFWTIQLSRHWALLWLVGIALGTHAPAMMGNEGRGPWGLGWSWRAKSYWDERGCLVRLASPQVPLDWAVPAVGAV